MESTWNSQLNGYGPFPTQFGNAVRAVINNNTACQYVHLVEDAIWIPPGYMQTVVIVAPRQQYTIQNDAPPGVARCHTIRFGEFSEVIFTDQPIAPNPGINLSPSASPTGAAGGDLSGTYPNPLVAGLQGVGVSATSPTNDQVLEFNSGTGLWTPTTLTISNSIINTSADIATSESTTSVTYTDLATPGPSITLTTTSPPTTWLIAFGCNADAPGAANHDQFMSIQVGATAATDALSAFGSQQVAAVGDFWLWRSVIIPTIPSGTVVTCKYRVDTAGITATFRQRHILAINLG